MDYEANAALGLLDLTLAQGRISKTQHEWPVPELEGVAAESRRILYEHGPGSPREMPVTKPVCGIWGGRRTPGGG